MPYDKEELEKFRQSGKILRETREEMRSYVRENMPIIEVCEKAEGLIRQKGGKPAFPCNVSINEVAAHYTSPPGDIARIPEGSTAKVDIGVQVDGYVTDTAFTSAFSAEGRSMTATAELALKTLIDNIHGDMALGKIGGLIETTIKNRGFQTNQQPNRTQRWTLLNPRWNIHPKRVRLLPKQSQNWRSLRYRTLRHIARSRSPSGRFTPNHHLPPAKSQIHKE